MKNFYVIGWGLGGSFGGINKYEVIIAYSEDDAEKWAYENAKDEYEQYSNCGLRTFEEIIEDEELSENDAELVYIEEVEDWIDYSAELYSKELAEKYGDLLYNRYEEETKNLK